MGWFCSFCKNSLRTFCLLTLLQVPVAFCASAAQVYQIGDDVPAGDEDFMWVDRNPYFEAAMTLFHIKDTEDHEDYLLLPYAVVVFLLAFFIRHNPINQAFGRIDVDTIHHDVLTRALQWVNDKLEDENSDLSSVSAFTDTVVAFREESTVELDQVLELSDPYDVNQAPAENYGFSAGLEGDSLIDDAGYLTPYGLLMVLVGPVATDAQRDATSEFRRQLTLICTAARASLGLSAGAVDVDRLPDFLSSSSYPFSTLPSLLFLIPQTLSERRLVVRALQHLHQQKEEALIFSMAVAFARNDEQFGLLVGDSTGYASTGLRRLLVALFPDPSSYSLANLSFLQAQLRLRYAATVGALSDESTVQERFQSVVDAILADTDIIAQDPKGGSSSGAGSSAGPDVAIKGSDLVGKILRTPAFLALQRAVGTLDKGHGDYKSKVLQLCLASKLPFVYQMVAHRHQTTVANKHHLFLSEIQSCSSAVGIALTRILYPLEPAAVFADAGLSSKVVANILRGEPTSDGLPAFITPATSICNLVVFRLEDIVNNKHRQPGYKFRIRPFVECYSLVNLTLLASKLTLLFSALKVSPPSLAPAMELYVGYDSFPAGVQTLIFAMITRLMHAIELRTYRFLHDLAHGDALHYAYPSEVALEEDAVALINDEHKDALQERRRYLRTFGYDPLDRGKRTFSEGPPYSAGEGTPPAPGSRKELIKTWSDTEFVFGSTTYPIPALSKLYNETKAADAPPFEEMCLPAGCCFAQGEAALMACKQYGTAGHEGVHSKFHVFPAAFRSGVKALGKSTAASSSTGGKGSPGGKGRGGKGGGRFRGKAPTF